MNNEMTTFPFVEEECSWREGGWHSSSSPSDGDIVSHFFNYKLTQNCFQQHPENYMKKHEKMQNFLMNRVHKKFNCSSSSKFPPFQKSLCCLTTPPPLLLISSPTLQKLYTSSSAPYLTSNLTAFQITSLSKRFQTHLLHVKQQNCASTFMHERCLRYAPTLRHRTTTCTVLPYVNELVRVLFFQGYQRKRGWTETGTPPEAASW